MLNDALQIVGVNDGKMLQGVTRIGVACLLRLEEGIDRIAYSLRTVRMHGDIIARLVGGHDDFIRTFSRNTTLDNLVWPICKGLKHHGSMAGVNAFRMNLDARDADNIGVILAF